LHIELVILAGLPPRSYRVQTNNFTIGRAADADFILAHPQVSRRHCRIIGDGTGWIIEDLGSQLGTVVNQVPIQEPTLLKVGDRIALGPVVLAFGQPEQGQEQATIQEGERRMLFRDVPVDAVRLEGTIVFGRVEDVDVQLTDSMVSRRHASVAPDETGFRVTDLHSRAGSFVNGRRFDEHHLVIGDQLQIGSFTLVFDGRSLQRIQQLSLGKLTAVQLERRAGKTLVLDQVSFVAEPGQFVGILGPSGAGKSTLLNALSGLRPADSGHIFVDRVDLYSNLGQLRSRFGYVPQDDIVHGELTVTQALTYSARLRLPRGTPQREIDTLVDHMVKTLGLADRKDLRISLLSGGQRKRVSVAVELLRRPPLLFLDEPTSGLDPFAEFKLMEILRRLADTGCTVICTTHVMENVFLMDQIAVLVAGRSVFQGPPDAARTRFGVPRLSGLYDALQAMDVSTLPSVEAPPPPEKRIDLGDTIAKQQGRKPFALPILLGRQFAIFRADLKNLLLLLGQPLVIGLLACWVTNDGPLVQFFVYIATLWFGCSNSAQEIVREIPIYRRERLVGLSRWSYLASKFVWMASLTGLQSLILFACSLLADHAGLFQICWQIVGLLLLSCAATGIGLALSAFARSTLQAVMLVPLILIPQILFSGFTVQTNKWSDARKDVLIVAQVMPSFAAERISDTCFLYGQQITGDIIRRYGIPYTNLNDWYRSRHNDQRIATGTTYTEVGPLIVGYLSLLLWTIFSLGCTYLVLARKEKDRE
jgi:ABC-type multidrug transport system ATPase subunit/pSer/pThr/pTyr-binding forkhead associated (FHA) protein